MHPIGTAGAAAEIEQSPATLTVWADTGSWTLWKPRASALSRHDPCVLARGQARRRQVLPDLVQYLELTAHGDDLVAVVTRFATSEDPFAQMAGWDLRFALVHVATFGAIRRGGPQNVSWYVDEAVGRLAAVLWLGAHSNKQARRWDEFLVLCQRRLADGVQETLR